MNRVLVVYYSHSGVTKKLADKIGKVLNADTYEVKPVDPYPADVFKTIEIFKDEFKLKSRREIIQPDVNMDNYDTILIGTPNWGNTVATPLLDFFDKVNLKEKTILPFVTHGGGGVGNCAKDIISLAGGNKNIKPLVLSSSRVSSVKNSAITSWIKEVI